MNKKNNNRILYLLKKYKFQYIIYASVQQLKGFYYIKIAKLIFFYWGIKKSSNLLFNGIPLIRNFGYMAIGNGTRIISSNYNVVGSETKTTLYTSNNGKIIIGKNVGLSNSIIVANSKIEISDNVFIGGGTKIFDNDFHSINFNDRINHPHIIPTKDVLIKKNCFIGSYSIILKGVTIGENSVIGAGSVVTKSTGDNEIWAGNPAKFIKKIK